MTAEEFEKFLSGSIAKALQSGVHQMEIIASLEVQKMHLMLAMFEANQPKITKATHLPMDGRGN